MRRGITSGEAQVMLKIGPDQRVQDTLITAYTHKGFAEAILAALPTGTYRPQRIDGQPVTTLAQLTVRFEVNGLVVIERHASDESPELFIGAFAYQACDPTRLDHPLQPVVSPSPAYPRELREQGIRGRVVVQYYVDENGRVRMPMIDRADNDVLAGLTLQAVEQWQFVPPSSHGRPVLVRARQAFLFAPDKAG
jgi:TonB family protein